MPAETVDLGYAYSLSSRLTWRYKNVGEPHPRLRGFEEMELYCPGIKARLIGDMTKKRGEVFAEYRKTHHGRSYPRHVAKKKPSVKPSSGMTQMMLRAKRRYLDNITAGGFVPSDSIAAGLANTAAEDVEAWRLEVSNTWIFEPIYIASENGNNILTGYITNPKPIEVKPAVITCDDVRQIVLDVLKEVFGSL